MKQVCVLGCGRLGQIVAGALAEGRLPGVELAGVFGRSPHRRREVAGRLGCACGDSLDALLSLRPDYVVEVANGQVLREAAVPVLAAGADLIVLSTGVFSDPYFSAQVRDAAQRYDRRVHLAAGVAAGFDLMRAARLMGPVEVTFTKQKPASASGHGDPALRSLDDRLSTTAGEAWRRFPDHMNVGVTVALATAGTEDTRVLVEPGEPLRFTTELSGAFGRASLVTELSTEGPELAAWSALAVLERLTSRICF